jgi:hypothetical protein
MAAAGFQGRPMEYISPLQGIEDRVQSRVGDGPYIHHVIQKQEFWVAFILFSPRHFKIIGLQRDFFRFLEQTSRLGA